MSLKKKSSRMYNEEGKSEIVNVEADETPLYETAADESGGDAVEIASADRLQAASALISRAFSLGSDYHITEFNDKGKVVKLTLDGSEFIVSVTIKNSENHPGFAVQ